MADEKKTMVIDIDQMIEDGVEKKLIFLASMAPASQFEKIAMNIKNPQIYQQFMALDEDAVVWDYAYAAGLIGRADADLMNSYMKEEEDEESNEEPDVEEPVEQEE